MEDKLILLVEDNPHIMAINDAALHMRGYRTLQAETYWECFFHLFIAVFSRFLFVLLTLWRSYLRCFRVFQRRLW